MAYEGSPVTPGIIYHTTVTSGAPMTTTWGGAQYSFPVTSEPMHEMYPAGFKDRICALVEAYEALVAATSEASDDYAGTTERDAESAARAAVDALRQELGL